MKTAEIKQMVTNEREQECREDKAIENALKPYQDIEYLCSRGRIPPPIYRKRHLFAIEKNCPHCNAQLAKRSILDSDGEPYMEVYGCPQCDYIYAELFWSGSQSDQARNRRKRELGQKLLQDRGQK